MWGFFVVVRFLIFQQWTMRYFEQGWGGNKKNKNKKTLRLCCCRFKEPQRETDNLEREFCHRTLSPRQGLLNYSTCRQTTLPSHFLFSPLSPLRAHTAPVPSLSRSGHSFPDGHPRTHQTPIEIKGRKAVQGRGTLCLPSLQGEG